MHELPVTCRVHELKTDIARIVESASDKLSLTHGGKACVALQRAVISCPAPTHTAPVSSPNLWLLFTSPAACPPVPRR